MSVLLEGSISKNNDGILTGKWRFMKENKNGNLQFKFTKLGSVIPRHLFNYVSFIDDGTYPVRGRGRKSKKPKAANVTTNDDASAIVVEGTSNSSSEAISATSGVDKEDCDDVDVDDEALNTNIDNSESAANNNEENNINNQPKTDVGIPETHPLFGYYEGSFDILTPQGTIQTTESFFFCSLLKEDVLKNNTTENDSDHDDNDENMNEELIGDFASLPPPPYLSTTIKRSVWNYTAGASATGSLQQQENITTTGAGKVENSTTNDNKQ